MRSRPDWRSVLVLAAAVSLTAGSCPTDDFAPPQGPPQLPPAGGGNVVLGTQSVAAGLARPVFVTAPRNDGRLFIVEQAGTIRIVAAGVLLAELFLDIRDLVRCCGEQGLLGLAFPIDYGTSGLFYIQYNNDDGDTVVARYRVSAEPNVADPASAENLLTVGQPFANHNGGTLAFGFDGFLYIGLGDGGDGGDPGNRAQNDATLLGKMLRIDVGGGPGSSYSIPLSNPFAGGVLPLPEIWAKGFRNPYRFAFDRIMGDMYVADVGQASREEISVEPFLDPGGRNYGWRLMEGFRCFNPENDCNDGTLTLPVHDYDHEGGRCSVTGGYVYRGAITDIFGHYFFADFCSAQVFSFVWDGAGGITNLTDRTAQLMPASGFSQITGFGEDGAGELYIVQFGAAGGGEVFRIVEMTANGPASAPMRQ